MLSCIRLFTFLPLLSACAMEPTPLYDGPKRDDKQVALFARTNAPTFTSAFYIDTVEIDHKSIMELGKPVWGIVALLPGKHHVRISFWRTEWTGITPKDFTTHFFNGWYDINFVAKPGLFYAPIFNLTLPEADMINEMCIAETSQSAGRSGTKDPKGNVACAKPNSPIGPDSYLVCVQKAGMKPSDLSEECRRKLHLNKAEY